MARRNSYRFTTIRSEGGLLPSGLLQRISIGKIEPLTPESYHLGAGETVKDTIARSWSRLLAVWRVFSQSLDRIPTAEPATTLTREKWLLPLVQELGFGRLPSAGTLTADGRSYAISHLWRSVPIHLVGAHVDLDSRTRGVAGAASATPHGLVQDFLNRSPEHLWAIVSNGLTLRVLRDHASLTRQAFVEFDLETMLQSEAYTDFALLWLVCHQSRFEADKPEQFVIERWSREGADLGIRALDHLRDGVQRAIEALGSGFVSYPGNAALKQALRSGELDTQDFYRELLRLVYRLIFVFVAEDRELLHPLNTTAAAKERYRRFYSTARLRDLARTMRGTRHPDLWRMLRHVCTSLHEHGNESLGLPAFGSFLWSPQACAHLDASDLSNAHLLEALRKLAFIEEGKTRLPIDWRNLGAEELGSVYESLLELHPEIHGDAARLELKSAAGHERKTTGSYYTPTSLIQCLLDSALDPVLAEAAAKPEPAKAILALKVCDPACGSGHFLVAAAHRIARRLASVRTGDDEASPEAYRTALRDVIGHCIYGVDLNPMAVELCKVSLWMEALEHGKPLSFLEHKIRWGNSLIGATPALIEKGIPDEAFVPIEGDDKLVTRELRKRNKDASTGQGTLFISIVAETSPIYGELGKTFAAIDAIDDGALAGVTTKAEQLQAIECSADYRKAALVADAWCAAFVWPKTKDGPDAVSQDVFVRLTRESSLSLAVTRREIEKLRVEYAFFHWHLAFPDVFRSPKPGRVRNEETGWEGGFDVVLGNPPWERVKLQEQEFFSTRSLDIASAANAAARKKLISSLSLVDPDLWAEWCTASRAAEGESHFIRDSGRYPLCGRGDVNTYAIFAEHNRTTLAPRGRAGFIVPTGVATDDTTKEFFRCLVDRSELARFFSFENEEFVFPSVHHAFRFALMVVDRSGQTSRADFVFFARQIAALADADRHFSLSSEEFALLNPNTRTCPTFRSRRDADINLALYRRAGVLWREVDPDGNPWGIRFLRMFDMANDSGQFRTRSELEAAGWVQEENRYLLDGKRMLPLIEAKMVHQFDHRFGTYNGQTDAQANQGKLPELDDATHADPYGLAFPNYWVGEAEVESRLDGRWHRGWLLGWRDICRSTDQRTVIASLIPRAAVGHTAPVMFTERDARLIAALYANLCSFVLDYSARQKVGGTHLTYGYLKQLPVLAPSWYSAPSPWTPTVSLRDWLLIRVLELTYTAWDLEPFARDCSYEGPPFHWDDDRRRALRAEIDAAFFHVYGLSRDDADYILDSFPVVKKNEEKAHGEYRTKRVILEAFDALGAAARSGQRYQSALYEPENGS